MADVKDPEQSACLRCIYYRIPIFGGYCAPTKNPSKSCLRHVSNEWSPQPCLRSFGFRRCLEHASIPRFVGKTGTQWGARHRASILSFAFFLSFVGWGFLIFASCALTSKKRTLFATHWLLFDLDDESAKIRLGLSHLGVSRRGFNYAQRKIEDACEENFVFQSKKFKETLILKTDDIDLFYQGSCTRCRRAAKKSASLAITATIVQVFQMTMALQRTTPFGDMNCQKMFGIAAGLYGFFATLASLRIFRRNCGISTDSPWSSARSEKVEAYSLDEETEYQVRLRVKSGLALSLLLITIWMKAIYVICHLLVPTPPAKHHKVAADVQKYDLTTYLASAIPSPTTAIKDEQKTTDLTYDDDDDAPSDDVEA